MSYLTDLSEPERTHEPAAKLELSDFEAALNSEFQMEPGPGVTSVANTSDDAQSARSAPTLTLVLTQCKVKLSNSMQECFALVFQASVEAPPVQGVYRLHHPVIGTADIFLVPFKKTDVGLYYEAIFNRLLV
jgi:hypothetical protein